jgi:hypothetical protein
MTTRHLVASLAVSTLILTAASATAATTATCAVEDTAPHLSLSFAPEPVADDVAPQAFHDLFAVPQVQAADTGTMPIVMPDDSATAAQDAPAPRPRAVQLSQGYEVRQKIHRLASWATLPLFVTEYVLGQKLYDGTGSEGVRNAHGALATGTAALFGVNTVTGVWNLWEARKKPEGRTRRIIHAVLMLGADAGFVATGMLAPDDEDDGGSYDDNRSRHRTVALASMGVATASYLYMFFTR